MLPSACRSRCVARTYSNCSKTYCAVDYRTRDPSPYFGTYCNSVLSLEWI